MTQRMRNVAGRALIAPAVVCAAAMATGTPAATPIGAGAVALALAVWLVRTWAAGPDLSERQRQLQVVAPVVLTALLVPALVVAGGGGTGDFATAYNQLVDWAEGDLGRVITVGLLVVGLAAGIVRQSVMAAVPAAGAGLALSVGPGIIDTIFGAAI